MAGFDDRDMDVEIIRDINDLAGRMPGWARDAVALTGEYLIPAALVAVVVAAWYAVRRRPDAHAAVAAVAWAGLASLVAWLVNAPIRDFVARPRPAVGRPELDLAVLVDGKTDYSFVSDHASMALAIAVALFLVHRWLGAVACALALVQGFLQVLMGLHYPSDVVGGYALGAAVALLLAPLAMAGLTPLARRGSQLRGLTWLAAPRPGGGVRDAGLEGAAADAAEGAREGARSSRLAA